MIRNPYEHAVFTLVYMNYKSFIAVETYDILLEIQSRICFEILMQEFDTILDCTFQKGPKLKLLIINIIQSEYGISIDQTDHIIKRIIQEYWVTNTRYEVRFQKPHFPVGTYFENKNLDGYTSYWIRVEKK